MKIKKQMRRFLLSFLAAVLVMTAEPAFRGMESPLLAWWGTLYPEFFFWEMAHSPSTETEKNITSGSTATRPKISFYLAKLLDW